MTSDFQKIEAKQCLWDQDGHHTKKRWRNRGKGRNKDKKLIHTELNLELSIDDQDRQYQYFKEIDEAMYCHQYGPCASCVAFEEERIAEENDYNDPHLGNNIKTLKED